MIYLNIGLPRERLLSKPEQQPATKSLMRMINSHNFQQLITKPTRVTHISKTLIDNL